jgi:ornithine cyclodeaminase
MERGEIFRAMQSGVLDKGKVKELGRVISGQEQGRTSRDQITVADLTGVAVQDINIAAAVFEAHKAGKV